MAAEDDGTYGLGRKRRRRSVSPGQPTGSDPTPQKKQKDRGMSGWTMVSGRGMKQGTNVR